MEIFMLLLVDMALGLTVLKQQHDGRDSNSSSNPHFFLSFYLGALVVVVQ
jgi:hypothetical protein